MAMVLWLWRIMSTDLKLDVEGLIAAALMVVTSPRGRLGSNPDARISTAELARDRMVAEFLGQEDAPRPESNFTVACEEGDILLIHLLVSDFEKKVAQMNKSKRSEGFTQAEEVNLTALYERIAAGHAIIARRFPASLGEAFEVIDHAFGVVCNKSA